MTGERVRGPRWARAAAPGRCPGYWVSVPLLLACLAGMLALSGRHFLDLEVYRLGVRAWLDGGDLYGTLPRTSMGNVLPFIYPPFAALVMVPLTVVPWAVAATAMVLISVAALGGTLYVTARRLWPSAGAAPARALTVALLGPSLFLEPVSQTFGFGQINLALMALVAADVLVRTPRWPRGALIGLAAAVKLTPGVFLLYFLLRGDRRAAVTTVLAAVAATGVGALVAPGPTLHYFLAGGAAGVSGSPFFTNQTFQAVLTRAGLTGAAFTAAWVALSAAALALALPAIRRGPAPLALMATAGVGLLVSPTSWSHHWVWIAPTLLVAGVAAARTRSRRWAGVTVALAALFVAAPFQFLPHDEHGLERTWNPAQQVVGASYVLAASAVLLLLWVSWRPRRRPPRAAGRTPRSSPATTSAR